MPGQQLIAPNLTSEAVAAQTSPQARRRRSTRLMKTGSFCSISSEGDGDIFGDDEVLPLPPLPRTPGGNENDPGGPVPRGSTSTGSSGKFDPLSDYSEFHNDDACSDISDLFLRPATSDLDIQPPLEESTANKNSEYEEQPKVQSYHQPINAQGTLSETGSLEDITYEVPTFVTSDATAAGVLTESAANNLAEKEEVSSCSLSIGSEDNNHQQIITVPVTIEHPPPEMRKNNNANSRQSAELHPLTVEAACQQLTPATIAHHLQPSDPTQISASMASSEEYEDALEDANERPEAAESMALFPMSLTTEEPGTRMVLVRDIGIQVCGDSPNLNLARKIKSSGGSSSGGSGSAVASAVPSAVASAATSSGHHHHHHHRHKNNPAAAANTSKQDSLAEKFPAEILF